MLVLCLGNPGPRYTPHAAQCRASWWPMSLPDGQAQGSRPAAASTGSRRLPLRGQELTLRQAGHVHEQQRAGGPEVLERYGLNPEALLVVLDDIALPLGSMRVRASGSDGGHNGLGSVIATLGTDRIARLRCGIRPEVPPPARVARRVCPLPVRPWRTGRGTVHDRPRR